MASNAQCQCNKCSKSNDCQNKFCIHCGNGLQNNSSENYSAITKLCAKCGFLNDEDADYCIQCGSDNFILQDGNMSIAGYIVILLAYIAKGDGVISNNEAIIIAKILDEASMDDLNLRNSLKVIFNNAKNKTERDYQNISQKLFDRIRNELVSTNERLQFLHIISKYFMTLVYADGKLNTKQNIIVTEILKNMQYTDRMINELHEQFKEEEEEEEQSSYTHQTNSDTSYKILGCHPSDADDTIKKAYRELAKQYHPDKLSGKDIPEAIMILATEKLKEINAAYEKIKKLRGMK